MVKHIQILFLFLWNKDVVSQKLLIFFLKKMYIQHIIERKNISTNLTSYRLYIQNHVLSKLQMCDVVSNHIFFNTSSTCIYLTSNHHNQPLTPSNLIIHMSKILYFSFIFTYHENLSFFPKYDKRRHVVGLPMDEPGMDRFNRRLSGLLLWSVVVNYSV